MSVCAQAVCLLEVKYGASPQVWTAHLPRWLADAQFATRFKRFVEHGRQWAHLSASERKAAIAREMWDADDRQRDLDCPLRKINGILVCLPRTDPLWSKWGGVPAL